MLRFFKQSVWQLAALAVSLFAAAPPVISQDLGNVALRTVQAQLATNVTCTGSAQNFATSDNNPAYPNFRNLGQGSHQASATSTAGTFSVEIDGIDAANIPLRISNPQVAFANGATTSYISQGTGYYPNIRVSVTCAAGATFSLSYTGSFGSSTTIIGAPSTAPIIIGPSFIGDVQGVIAQGVNGTPVLPVIAGGLGPATNALLAAFGVDTVSTANGTINTLGGGTVSFNLPGPTNAGEFALLGLNPWFAANTFTAGWTQQLSGSGGATHSVWTRTVSSPQSFSNTYQNTQTPLGASEFSILLNNPPTSIVIGSNNVGNATPVVTPQGAGSLILAFASCSNIPCGINAATDTQGNTYRLVASVPCQSNCGVSGVNSGGIGVLAATAASGAADTITITTSAGTINNSSAISLAGVTAAGLNAPAVSLTADANGRLIPGNTPGVTDPCQSSGAIKVSVPINIATATTTQLITGAAGKIPYVCGGFVEIASSATAAATIQFEYGTTANCATGTTALTGTMGTGTATAAIDAEPIVVPHAIMNWTVPAGNNVCALTAGTTVSAQGWLIFVLQ